MFTSFIVSSGNERIDERETSSKPTERAKRRQVNRACTWCRTYRIKCDANYPCENCKIKGRKCSVEGGKGQVRTYASAIGEIDRLKGRVQELEKELKTMRFSPEAFKADANAEPIRIKKEELLPDDLDPLSQHGGHKRYYNWDFATKYTRPGSNQTYGPSSHYYFINQLGSYLDTYLLENEPSSSDQSHSRMSMANRLSNALVGREPGTMSADSSIQDLNRAEEERLLALFWHSWNATYPILDEKSFKTHYESLWRDAAGMRYPSALVDIVLALCMQYDSAKQAAKGDQILVQPTDSTAGWWFYRRCQYFLQDEMEAPSITTFQCHLLAVIWLSQASWQNAAHNVLAAGLRVGVILGLHSEPCENLPDEIKQRRRRLWWTMYAMDAQYAMEFGRPLGVHFSQVTCKLPAKYAPSQDSNDLKSLPMLFNEQYINLILAYRAIYVLFYRVCAEVLRKTDRTSLYQDPRNLETCAEWVEQNTKYLKAWIRQVPDSLQPKRHGLGLPFSTDGTRIKMPRTSDTGYRTGMMLELLYHQFCIGIFRTFINFTGKHTDAPVTKRLASACLKHAITVTTMIYQDLTESDFLITWQTATPWQWYAVLALVGYATAYPDCPLVAEARKSLLTALTNFNILARTFTIAKGPAQTLQCLINMIDSMQRSEKSSCVSKANFRNTLSMPTTSPFLGQERSDTTVVAGDSGLVSDPGFYMSELMNFAEGSIGEDWVFNLLELENGNQQ